MATITCGHCKTTNSLSSFCIGVPQYEYKCPACGHHFRVVATPLTEPRNKIIVIRPGRKLTVNK